MTAFGRPASSAARKFFSFFVIATFSLWVNEAQAMSSGGGGGGGSAGGGGAAGGAGGNAGGPGGGGGDSIFSDRKQDTVTRSRTPDEIVAPVGYVISDDVCTGGKYEKC